MDDKSSGNAVEYSYALIYFTDLGEAGDRGGLPLDTFFPNKHLAVFRSNW